MMEAEIHAIRRALKMLDHSDISERIRAHEAERAVDAIEKALNAPARKEKQDGDKGQKQ